MMAPRHWAELERLAGAGLLCNHSGFTQCRKTEKEMADAAEDSSLGTTWPSSTSAEGEKGGEEGEPASFEMGAAGGRRKEKRGHRVGFVEEEGAEGEADDGGQRKGPKWRDVRSTVVHALFRSAEDERRPSRTRPKGANLGIHSFHFC
jgi:hypothetical protein